ncbi:unnamed protein product, partial [Polarella glacialis]
STRAGSSHLQCVAQVCPPCHSCAHAQPPCPPCPADMIQIKLEMEMGPSTLFVFPKSQIDLMWTSIVPGGYTTEITEEGSNTPETDPHEMEEGYSYIVTMFPPAGSK